jgi:hypothetical protein
MSSRASGPVERPMNVFKNSAQSLTGDVLSDVERRLGFRLPDDIRRQYLVCNGGIPEKRYYLTKQRIELGVTRFLPSRYRTSPRSRTLEEVVESLVHEKKLIPEHLLPFAENDGGDFYCLDRRDQSVVYYTMDDCLEPTIAAKRVADSLPKFINEMVTEEEAARRRYGA